MRKFKKGDIVRRIALSNYDVTQGKKYKIISIHRIFIKVYGSDKQYSIRAFEFVREKIKYRKRILRELKCHQKYCELKKAQYEKDFKKILQSIDHEFRPEVNNYYELKKECSEERPIEDWLMEIEDPEIRAKALYNRIKYPLDNEMAESVSEAIKNGFSWPLSKEKISYWVKLHVEILRSKGIKKRRINEY